MHICVYLLCVCIYMYVYSMKLQGFLANFQFVPYANVCSGDLINIFAR